MSRRRSGSLPNPTALWLAVRVRLNQIWRSALALAVLFGGIAGLAGASLTQAARIESAYDDLLRDVDPPQAVSGCVSNCNSLEEFMSFVADLQADPAVADAVVFEQYVPILRSESGELLGPESIECLQDQSSLGLIAADWPRTPPVRVVEGRLAQSPTEIALPLVTAQRAGVKVGDQVVLDEICFAWEPLDNPIRLTVSGLFVGFLDVRPPGQPLAFEYPIVTTDFADAAGIEASGGAVALWLEPGRTTADLRPPNASTIIFDTSSHASEIRSHLQPDATALRLFAAIMLVASLVVLGQLLARHVRSASTNHSYLRSLGWRPLDLTVLGVVHGVVVGFAAGIAASCATIGLLPLIPLGAAEYAAQGTDAPLPWTAALVTAAAIALVIIVISIAPALKAARGRSRHTSVQTSLADRVADGAKLPPAPAWGLRIALEPDRTAQVPVRSGLGALVIAVAVVAGVVTFAAGLDHLRTTPRLVGWNWDMQIDADEYPPGIEELLNGNPDIARWSRGNPGVGLSIGDTQVELNYLSFSTGPNAVQPVAISGRAARGADEIMLTAEMAARLSVQVGDIVEITAEDWLSRFAEQVGATGEGLSAKALPFEVVGTGVVFVSALERGGAALTTDGVERIYSKPTRDALTAVLVAADFELLIEALVQEYPVLAAQLMAGGPARVTETVASWTDVDIASLTPSVRFNRLYIELVDGADPADMVAVFNGLGIGNGEPGSEIHGVVDGRLAATTEVVALDLEDVDWLPAGLGAVMSLTAAAVVAHLIASTARARRRDLATLQALGFSRRQVRSVVFWQACAAAIVTAVIAIPLGAVAGRLAWHAYAEGIDVVPESVTPWGPLGLVAVALVFVAELAAAGPAFAAARRPPLTALRSD